MGVEQQILDAALKVFSSQGYTGATTRRIAEEANVAEVTIFRKFQSKENLLKEVLIRNRVEISELDNLFRIEEDVDIETELLALGKKIAKDLSDKKKDSKNRIFMFMLFEEGRNRAEVSEILTSVFQDYITRLSEFFELQVRKGKLRTINTRSAALTFISYFVYTSLIKGVLEYSFLGNDDEEVERFIDIFTHGVLKVE
jgi:AcrR family transcriptional regulator